MLYDPYSYYGYGGYGYSYSSASMYNTSYYSQLMSAMYAQQSSSATFYYADYMNYFTGRINGNGAVRHPQLQITYAIMEDL